MLIRNASLDDVHAISTLLTQLTEKFIVSGITDKGKKKLLHSMRTEAVRDYLEQGYRYHVADNGGSIAGVVATKDDSHLYHLFVRETEQGTGLARRLWERALADCCERSSPEYFTVNSSLNAREVYESWGFVPTAGVREKGGIKDIPMKLKLTN